MQRLAQLPQPPRFAEGYTALMGDSLCGAHMGIDLRDEQSGLLTINAGQLAVEEGEVRVYFDIRYPVTASGETVLARMRAAAAPYGLRVWKRHEMRPVYMDKNSRVIRSLLAAYREQTGDMGEPLVVGGGTYARAMKNIAAFGPGRPGRASTEHEADEHLPVEELLRLREIYRAAPSGLTRLAKSNSFSKNVKKTVAKTERVLYDGGSFQLLPKITTKDRRKSSEARKKAMLDSARGLHAAVHAPDGGVRGRQRRLYEDRHARQRTKVFHPRLGQIVHL